MRSEISQIAAPSSVAETITRVASQFQAQRLFRRSDHALPVPSWEWNHAQDTKYSHKHKIFKGVLHLFHSEWHGIRAACGSLPGDKLAIPETIMPEEDIIDLAGFVISREPRRIVYHGFSDNVDQLIRVLDRCGLRGRQFLIFHGSPAQWWNETERRYAFGAIRIAQSGHLAGLHIMKAGMEMPDTPLYRPLLYNISPRFHPKVELQVREDVVAFVPGWGNWIKNVFGSACGAALSSKVNTVWAYSTNLDLPPPLDRKLTKILPGTREKTFQRYVQSDVTLNVSLIDCHPMVNVESQSVGVPCVRANLYLDAHEDHPYVRLVTVRHNNSVSDIRDAVDRVLQVPANEIREMISDYQVKIDRLSVDRYVEFLGL